MEGEELPVINKPYGDKTSDGLPIFKKKETPVSKTSDGLPILKKPTPKKPDYTESVPKWNPNSPEAKAAIKDFTQRQLSRNYQLENPGSEHYKQLAEQEDKFHKEHPGSWSNTMPQLEHALVGMVTKPLASAAHISVDAAQAMGFKGTDKSLSQKLATGLDAYNNETEKSDVTNPLPNTFLGNTSNAAIHLAPIVLGAKLFPEAEIGEDASALQQLKHVTINPFTKISALEGGLDAYDQARQKGLSQLEATKEGAKGAVREGMSAATMNVLGSIGGDFVSPKLAKGLTESGILSDGKLTKMGTDAVTDAMIFGTYPVLSHLATDGTLPDKEEVEAGLGTGLLFGGLKALKTHGEFTDAGNKLAEAKKVVAMKNFIDASPDAIKEAYELPGNPADINAKAVDYADKANKETDIDSRKQLIAASAVHTKAANVKTMAQAILADKDGFVKSVESSELPDEQKQQVIDKINTTYKQLDPIEKQKTELGDKVDDNLKKIKELDNIEPKDYVHTLELREQKSTLEKENEELTNKLTNLIKQQNDKNERKGGLPSATEEIVSPQEQTGEGERPVQEGRTDGKERLTQSGEASAEPDLKQQDNAVQEQEAEGVPVQSAPGHSEKVAEGNAKGEETTEQGQTKKEKIDEKPEQGEGKAVSEKDQNNAKDNRFGVQGRVDSENEDAEAKRVKPTSIKKVITEATRQEKGLPEVDVPQTRTPKEILEHGKKLVSTGEVKPTEVIDRVIANKGIFTPDEAAAMQYHLNQLEAEDKNLRSQLDDVNKKLQDLPNSEQHLKAKALLLGNLRQLDDRYDDATRADRINSRSWGNLGRVMQVEADSEFNPVRSRSIIRDNYGGEIPKDVQERINKAEAERDKAIADLKKATEEFTNNQGKKAVEKIRKSVGLVKQSKAELEAEAEQLKTDLRKALKSDFSRVNSGIPIPTETLEVLGKLAVNYFKQGIKDFEGLANRIYDDLKETGITKAQVKEHISNYDPLRETSRERDIELLGRKERSAEKQVQTGKFIDRSKKPKIVYPKNDAIVKSEQRVHDAEFKLRQEKEKSYKKAKSKVQRGLDWVIRWERRFVLSSPAILAKLGSAVTIGSAFKRLPEEAIGGLWTKAMPELMSKAPIEGGFNAKAEAEYWKEFSNPKKFFHNAKEILKTGASDLTKEFSDKPHEHYKYYDALTDLHPIIKDLTKRGTYEASLVKGLNWAERNGLDISDPLIRQNIKQMAYNRAEYEIFQENSGWNRRLQNFISDQKTPKGTKDMLKKFGVRFMLPVSTVPLNIARRIGNYATGLPRGLINAREAYSKGIDNLSNEHAEIIAKQLKQGSMGAALISMGLFGVAGAYGGLYNKDNAKNANETGGMQQHGATSPGFNEMYFAGHAVPKSVQHALPLQLIQLGATMRGVYSMYINKYTYGEGEYKGELEKQMEALSQSIMVGTGAIASEIPMVETPVNVYESFRDPYARKKLAEDLKRRVTPTVVSDATKLIKK